MNIEEMSAMQGPIQLCPPLHSAVVFTDVSTPIFPPKNGCGRRVVFHRGAIFFLRKRVSWAAILSSWQSSEV
jgi:hypothetical protein